MRALLPHQMLDFGKGKAMALTVSNPYEETTRDFLARREHELRSRIAALRGQLSPLEAELTQVQQMIALIPQPDPGPALKALADVVAAQTMARRADTNTREPVMPKILGHELPDPTSIDLPPVENPWANFTIKDLVIQALLDAFPQGATATEIRNFILNGYHRAIDAGSLRTQLHRLKQAGILGQEPNGDLWNFRDGQRRLLAIAQHQVVSRPSQVDWDDPLIKQAVDLAWKDEDDQK